MKGFHIRLPNVRTCFALCWEREDLKADIQGDSSLQRRDSSLQRTQHHRLRFVWRLLFNSVCHFFNVSLAWYEKIGISTDSKFSHFAWANQPRKEGGLGPDLKVPLIADKSMNISRDYGVLLEDEGISLRGLFIIDPKGVLRWVGMTHDILVYLRCSS